MKQQNLTLSREQLESTWAWFLITAKTSRAKVTTKVCWNGSLELHEKQEGGGLCFSFPSVCQGCRIPTLQAALMEVGTPAATCWEPGDERIPS